MRRALVTVFAVGGVVLSGGVSRGEGPAGGQGGGGGGHAASGGGGTHGGGGGVHAVGGSSAASVRGQVVGGGTSGRGGRVDGSRGTVIDHRPHGGGGSGGAGGSSSAGYVLGGPVFLGGSAYALGGGLDHAVVCVQDPEDPDRCVDANPSEAHPVEIRDGGWMRAPSAPHTVVDVGSYMRHFADPGIAQGRASQLRLGGASSDHGVSGVVRAGLSARHVYGLAELEIGGLTSGPDPALAGSQLITTSFGYAGVVGIAEPIGTSRVALEGAFGARTLVYNVDNMQSSSATSAVVEARVRAETWVTPWLSLGGIAGASVIEKSDWMAGVTVGFHTRAYGGQR